MLQTQKNSSENVVKCACLLLYFTPPLFAREEAKKEEGVQYGVNFSAAKLSSEYHLLGNRTQAGTTPVKKRPSKHLKKLIRSGMGRSLKGKNNVRLRFFLFPWL